MVLVHIGGCACGKENVMDIELKAEIISPAVSSGDAVTVRLVLTNNGAGPIEISSLDGNNDITNYQLEDKDGKLIGIYNHVSRQVLLEFQRIRYGDQEMQTLEPGEKETRDYNFLLLHWLDTPGTYRIRGLYKWNDMEILSEPAEFEILPADVAAYDQQWCYNYGEKYYLHSAAVFENDNHYRLILKQSQRFSPTVVDFNHEVYRRDRPFTPLVAFNRAMRAESLVWLTWADGSKLYCLKTDFGQTTDPPFCLDTQLSEIRIIAPPLLNADKTLTIVIRGKAKDAATCILIIKINGSGKEISRSPVTYIDGQDSLMRCLMDEAGGLQLVWICEKSGKSELCTLQLDPDAGSVSGQVAKLWETDESVPAIVTPSLLRVDDRSIYCVTQTEQAKNKITLTRIFMDGGKKPVQMKKIKLPLKYEIKLCRGEVDEKKDVHAAFPANGGDLLYLDFLNEKLVEAARGIVKITPSLPRLFVNDRNDVFVGYNLPDRGLEWKLIEREVDERY
jgi:hypothetical protein